MNSDNWFVAQLKPSGLAAALRNLGRQKFATLSPTRIETIRVRNVLKPTPRALFPGYLFVQFKPEEHGWQSINSTLGVSRLLLNDIRKPLPLPSQFMAGLIARCNNAGHLESPANVKIGDHIRVLSGPFADLVTTVDRLDKSQRIQVLIELMGRTVRTSIPRTHVGILEQNTETRAG